MELLLGGMPPPQTLRLLMRLARTTSPRVSNMERASPSRRTTTPKCQSKVLRLPPMLRSSSLPAIVLRRTRSASTSHPLVSSPSPADGAKPYKPSLRPAMETEMSDKGSFEAKRQHAND
jgi:hypothetical protein